MSIVTKPREPAGRSRCSFHCDALLHQLRGHDRHLPIVVKLLFAVWSQQKCCHIAS